MATTPAKPPKLSGAPASGGSNEQNAAASSAPPTPTPVAKRKGKAASDIPPATVPAQTGENSNVVSVISHVADHSNDAVSAWLRVTLADGTTVWRHEKDLWEDRRAMVLAYWSRCEGGRENQLDPQNAYIPTKIVAEKPKAKKRYQVLWLGYAETTWETRYTLQKNHACLIEEWDHRGEVDLGQTSTLLPVTDANTL